MNGCIASVMGGRLRFQLPPRRPARTKQELAEASYEASDSVRLYIHIQHTILFQVVRNCILRQEHCL